MGFLHQPMPKLLSKAVEIQKNDDLSQRLSAAVRPEFSQKQYNINRQQTDNGGRQKKKLNKREIQDRNGRVFKLSKPISQGGEAIVWKLAGQPKICAKIYKKSISKAEYKKLICLIQRFQDLCIKEPNLCRHLAVPKEIVFDGQCHPIGYIMRYVNGKEISSYICSDILLCESYTRQMQIDIVFQIAYVMQRLHSYDIIIGDISPQNILVENGCVTFVDLNAVEFSYNGVKYECGGVHFQYTPPEYIRLSKYPVSESTDVWGLQVLAFELFLPGYQPYNYRCNLSFEEDTEHGNYFWYRPEKVVDKVGYLLLNSLNERVQTAFYEAFSSNGKCFTADTRISAKEWENHIASLYQSA